VKTAGPLYGIPIHPLMMFKTHDSKISEHDLSIDDCMEQLKEVNVRLVQLESSNGNLGEVAGGDLTNVINDDFINSVVDNIMNTTNFASIIESVIPLQEDNEHLKKQVSELYDSIHKENSKYLNQENDTFITKFDELHNYVEILNSKIYELKEQIQRVSKNINEVNSKMVYMNVVEKKLEVWNQKMQQFECKCQSFQPPHVCSVTSTNIVNDVPIHKNMVECEKKEEWTNLNEDEDQGEEDQGEEDQGEEYQGEEDQGEEDQGECEDDRQNE
jgi:uncharacterized protein YqgV (UPF0045/DUF77 family)